MMSSSMGKMMKTMTENYTGLCKSHLNMDLSSTERNAKSRRTQLHSLVLSMMQMELTQTLRK